MQLTQKQEEAFQAIKSGKNICITGSAGTGKSEIIKLFRNLYQNQRVVVTTSTTGISALLIGGTTLHSYLGIGLGTGSPGALITKIHKKAYLRQRWKKLETLIIDEISMLSPVLFDKLESIARAIRKDDRPFGGIQLVLSGDFLQLPVVGEDKFCFEAKSWDKCIDTVIYLKEIIRQDDQKFKKCLGEVRMGKLSKESKELLKSCKNKKLENNLGIKPTKIYSTNAEVDEKNEEELDILAQDNRTFIQYDMEYDVYTNDRYINVQKYCKDCTAPESVQLCVGAQVMLVWNLDIENGLVNGSRGVVTEFVEEMPRVQFLNGEHRIIDYNIWEVMDKDTKLMSITQVPLKLAWSCTIHKCVSENTLIPTPNGLLRIKDLANSKQKNNSIETINQPVLGQNGICNATEVYKGQKEQTYILTTRRGYTITGSSRHPVLIGNNKWKKLPFIKSGEAIWLRNNLSSFGPKISTESFIPSSKALKQYDIPSYIDEKLSYIIGILIGDGYYSVKKDYPIEFSKTKEEISLKNIFQEYTKACFGSSFKDYTEENNPSFRLIINSMFIREFFVWCGLDYVTAKDKRIPWSILRNTKECQIACLQGLFDTDGGVNTIVHYTTISKQLAIDICTVLLNLGIISSLRPLNGKSREKFSQAYRVQISGYDAHKFYQLVGFKSLRKQSLLVKKFGNYRYHTVKADLGGFLNGYKIALRLRNKIRQFCIENNMTFSWRHPIREVASMSQLLNRIVTKGSKLHYYSFRHICDIISKYYTPIENLDDKIYQLYKNHIFCDEVESVKLGKEEVLYDIGVPNDHTFIGNGIINHNSQGSTIDYAIVDMNNIFTYGQAYVALSRVRTINGLCIEGLHFKKIKSHPKAIEFYKKLEEN